MAPKYPPYAIEERHAGTAYAVVDSRSGAEIGVYPSQAEAEIVQRNRWRDDVSAKLQAKTDEIAPGVKITFVM